MTSGRVVQRKNFQSGFCSHHIGGSSQPEEVLPDVSAERRGPPELEVRMKDGWRRAEPALAACIQTLHGDQVTI
jgi:hypothetical protein